MDTPEPNEDFEVRVRKVDELAKLIPANPREKSSQTIGDKYAELGARIGELGNFGRAHELLNIAQKYGASQSLHPWHHVARGHAYGFEARVEEHKETRDQLRILAIREYQMAAAIQPALPEAQQGLAWITSEIAND